MANGGEKSNDFYATLGLEKECTDAELRNAYKKLAMRWHPDRCSALGNSTFIEEAKSKFQAIQQAYSVLSDTNKRFMYDIGVYESDDDENGMGDFLNEMTFMMSQTKPNKNGEETFEELQELFEEMFQDDIEEFRPSSLYSSNSCSTSSSYGESPNPYKQNSFETIIGDAKIENSGFNTHFHSFCLGVERRQQFKKGIGARGGSRVRPGGSSSSSSSRSSNRRSQGRNKNVSATNYGISSSSS